MELAAYIYLICLVEDPVHHKILVTLADVVKQKMIEELVDADARLKWAQDHVKIGFTG